MGFRIDLVGVAVVAGGGTAPNLPTGFAFGLTFSSLSELESDELDSAGFGVTFFATGVVFFGGAFSSSSSELESDELDSAGFGVTFLAAGVFFFGGAFSSSSDESAEDELAFVSRKRRRH